MIKYPSAILAALLLASSPLQLRAQEPSLENVPYGSHERQVLDFYKAKSDQPAPLVFFMHSGGWMNGDKKDVPHLQDCLKSGISVVSINYRFIPDASSAGVSPPVKICLDDAAHALQFVRSRAKEWNIDPNRICASGASAGGFMALWLGFHPDMADPKNSDPIAHESTRVSCALTYNSQTSLDPVQMRQWVPNNDYGHHAFLLPSYQAFLDKRDQLLPLIKEYSPYELASADDPPVYLSYSTPPEPGQPAKDPPHSANFGVGLAEKLKQIGTEFELNYPGAPNVKHPDPLGFLMDKLKVTASGNAAAPAPAPAGGEPPSLFDPANPAAIKPTQASVTIIDGPETKILQAEFEKGAAYPGLEFPMTNNSDLSAFAGVEASVANVGPSEVKVGLRVDNPGDFAQEPWNTEIDSIAPGETKRIAVTFGRSFGAPGYALNPAQITRILIFVPSPTLQATLQIRRLAPFHQAPAATQDVKKK